MMIVIDNDFIQVLKLELEIENTRHITNTYIIKDKKTSKLCIIDPALDENKINYSIKQIQGCLECVIITHAHADHIAALAGVTERTECVVYIHNLDKQGLYDKNINEEEIVGTKVKPVQEKIVKVLENNEIIKLGDTILKVIHTPGHTKGSICIFDEKNNILYSGDTIFENSYGRTDLIMGSHEDMKNTLDMLITSFEDVLVCPGHGNVFNFKDSKRKIKLLFAYKG